MNHYSADVAVKKITYEDAKITLQDDVSIVIWTPNKNVNVHRYTSLQLATEKKCGFPWSFNRLHCD